MLAALEVVWNHFALEGKATRVSHRRLTEAERVEQGWQGPLWRQRVADHGRVKRAVRALMSAGARDSGGREDDQAERRHWLQAAATRPLMFSHPPAQERGRTAGEEAQLGMSLAAGPGGENVS